MEEELYNPEEDNSFKEPYTDTEEWRDLPVRHFYVHGGFKGTDIDGENEVRFCFYFPEKEKYEGRFYQYLSPAPEDEHESEHLTGEDDKITFALTHGAYYVVSNQGGFVPPMGQRLYRASSNTAVFGRKLAKKLYGTEARPFGYVFGGSGGSFKTMSCMESTKGVWDGAVPYVLANPMATPNVFCPRVRAMRVLRGEGLKKVVDAMEPGGSGDIYAGLSDIQTEVLKEATKMGFPKRGWFSWPTMGDGALMVLAPSIYKIFPDYFTDFWIKPGFAGADPDSSESRDRVKFKTVVTELIKPEKKADEQHTSVDNSWINTMIGSQDTPRVRIAEMPPEGSYIFHCRIRVMNGKAVGKEMPIDKIEDSVITVSSAFDGSNEGNALEGLAVGDTIVIDNSDYLAMQTFERHQVPDESYTVYDQFRDKDGRPLYPQLPFLLAPGIAMSAGGSVPCGKINGKVIAVCSILDESALAWHGDWYRKAVRREKDGGEDSCFRLYYNDNCIHDDRAGYLDDPQHQIDYLGILHQALLDVAAWCEKGIAPRATTNYVLNDGQIEVPENAKDRGGLQPVVKACVNGRKCVTVKTGEEVHFSADIEVPYEEDSVTEAAWDFEKTNDFSSGCELNRSGDSETVNVRAEHKFEKPGTYFPVIKVKSCRKGYEKDIFVQCKNLDRVRVIVE
ncbi:MAG TPA: hypothetical protein PLN48_04940 [Lachnospiraceae bacterium]|nr:hypothetical protein [Lachnospiraceae bacterium]